MEIAELYDLTHSYATTAQLAGVDPKTVKRALAHRVAGMARDPVDLSDSVPLVRQLKYGHRWPAFLHRRYLLVVHKRQQGSEVRRVSNSYSAEGGQFLAAAKMIAAGATTSLTFVVDGRGRAIDNVFVERLWRTIKQEYIDLNPTSSCAELIDGLANYIEFYNAGHLNDGMGARTSDEVYFEALGNLARVA